MLLKCVIWIFISIIMGMRMYTHMHVLSHVLVCLGISLAINVYLQFTTYNLIKKKNPQNMYFHGSMLDNYVCETMLLRYVIFFYVVTIVDLVKTP